MFCRKLRNVANHAFLVLILWPKKAVFHTENIFNTGNVFFSKLWMYSKLGMFSKLRMFSKHMLWKRGHPVSLYLPHSFPSSLPFSKRSECFENLYIMCFYSPHNLSLFISSRESFQNMSLFRAFVPSRLCLCPCPINRVCCLLFSYASSSTLHPRQRASERVSEW